MPELGRPIDRARRVEIRIPTWTFGGNIAELARALNWDIAQSSSGVLVRARERARGTTPSLLTVQRIANAATINQPGGYAQLVHLPAHAQHLSIPEDLITAELRRLAPETDMAVELYKQSLATLTVDERGLAACIKRILRDSLLPALPEASAHMVRFPNNTLSFRYAIVRLLLAAGDDPALLGSPPPVGEFRSAQGLFSDTTFGLAAYVSPLLLSLSPNVWGIAVARAGGLIIYVFGRALPGRERRPMEALQLFTPAGRQHASTAPIASPTAAAFERAVTWWFKHLDKLLSIATDPSNHVVNATSVWESRDHFERLLSLEQLFRQQQALLSADRDDFVRQTLMFESLDTLEGLHLLDFRAMTTLTKAKTVLTELERDLGSDIAGVLLPRCRAAVGALEHLQGGFFLPSRVVADRLQFIDKKGRPASMSLEEAASSYLRVLRNAKHTFHSRGSVATRDEAVLMSHDGHLPRELPDLSYLFLVRLLNSPDLLVR